MEEIYGIEYDRNLFRNNDNYLFIYNEYYYHERYEEVQKQIFYISNYLIQMLNCIMNHDRKIEIIIQIEIEITIKIIKIKENVVE